jgi:molybdopterin-guanine dinucleotide biosynthesis protein B
MPPVLAFIGKPGCGKTTLIEKLIPALARYGVRTGTIKHHHGPIEMDTPGKDTWRHMQAGARAVLLSSPAGIGFIQKTAEDTPVKTLIRSYFDHVDLVFLEGYKQEKLPKIEVFRSTLYDTPLEDPGETLIAAVSDVRIRPECVWFKPDDTEPLVSFILEKIVARHD